MSPRGRKRDREAVTPPSAPGLIARKRDGDALTADEIAWLIRGFTTGDIPDYQMSAFAMAVLLRGMDAQETTALTLAMRDSGARARLRAVAGAKVDKHSTGGVGDKVSIALAPWVASCGLVVPMIAGRGLGHTGGTIDKLEAIDGFRTALSLARFERLVAQHGFAIMGQTDAIAPADRKLYALRDVTATVPSIPLITASILSKKLCEDLDALVLDVKVGRGAFMNTVARGRELASSIVSIGARTGLKVTAMLTRMDCPLGRTIGNALETREALELLHGQAADDLLACTLALGTEMLVSGGVARGVASAERRMLAALAGGEPRRRMAALVRAQGGDPRVVEEPDRLPRARDTVPVRADAGGYVTDLDARALGDLSMALGAGRVRGGAAVSPVAGIVLHRKPGDRVARGDLLAEAHLADGAPSALRKISRVQILEAYRIGRRRRARPELIIEVVRPAPERGKVR